MDFVELVKINIFSLHYVFRVGRRERERERGGGILFNIRYVSSKDIKRIMLSKVIVHEIA